eukprot:Gb_16261 [translate_table: standard]
MESLNESKMLHFVEGRSPEQKLQDGHLFPKVFLPAHQSQREDIHAVLESIKEEKQCLESELHEAGVLLFRGFATRSASDFNAFVEAFGWEEQIYEGAAPRINVVGKVWTANEAPLHKDIFFHHEMALVEEFPSKLLFFCEIAPPEGTGQTAVVLSHRVAQHMENKFPSLVEKLDREGILTCTPLAKEDNPGYFLGKSWQSHLKTNDPKEAKRRVAAAGSKLEWMEDGSANIIAGPIPARRIFEGYNNRKVWFNYIPAATFKNTTNILKCGDGSAIPSTLMEECIQVMNNECVEMKWEAGDVLLIDNLAVMHARRPSKPPRRVLVAMCK